MNERPPYGSNFDAFVNELHRLRGERGLASEDEIRTYGKVEQQKPMTRYEEAYEYATQIHMKVDLAELADPRKLLDLARVRAATFAGFVVGYDYTDDEIKAPLDDLWGKFQQTVKS